MTPTRLANAQVDALYRAHAAGLRRFLFGVLRSAEWVEEALQQTFVEVLEKGHLAAAETMKGWIYKVAFHQAMTLKRRRQLPTQAFDAAELRGMVPVDASAEERASEAERQARAEAAVAGLPAAQQQVLRLRLFEQRNFAEIAAQLGIPLGTALTRMRLALTKLRKQLRDDDGEPDE